MSKAFDMLYYALYQLARKGPLGKGRKGRQLHDHITCMLAYFVAPRYTGFGSLPIAPLLRTD